eukprot:12935110-Prorocentrum_lima.AAC.1
MAGPFQSARREVHCYNCKRVFSFLKMIESWRPEHSLYDPMNIREEEGKRSQHQEEGVEGSAP